jgi:hypothetical protein
MSSCLTVVRLRLIISSIHSTNFVRGTCFYSMIAVTFSGQTFENRTTQIAGSGLVLALAPTEI